MPNEEADEAATRDLRICVLGGGRAGMVHATNLRWHVPHAELVAIVDANPQRAQEAASELHLNGGAFDRLSDALRSHEIDAVVITTPTFTHHALVREAASHGLHVLCEKPMALTLQECDAMEAACEQAGIVFQVGFMRRFDPPFVRAKRDLDAGAVGTPLLVRSLTRGPGLPPTWANDPAKSNGMLAEVNSHDFDTVRWLGGGEYRSVHARVAAAKRPDLQREWPGFYDLAVVSVELDNGAFGLIDGVCPAEYGYDARAEIVGSTGVLFAGELVSEHARRVTHQEGAVQPHYMSWRQRFIEAYRAEAADFLECIRSNTAPHVGPRDGRAAVAAVLAANRSAHEERSVRVDT